ncbi:2'-5' RNA ligase [Desulfocicer vacuolatum DSM 3385]|uniref:RNA 2',3'-cyclic phosphodiesterase n=1 Tax=Desulfocicer vacuolatum DSM 3385 TaxID=1121400 RepID=A0A1W2DL06_9BACT|nr:RNA 2',3'-cyclic phosphodiesterase [Desulfocicer vacuolatum]SMC98135.1 2'-5' RNA ligase [Desulfocicer vacuolatum DSM 3385]
MKKTDNGNLIRAFIAIPIPENISLFLHKVQGEIRQEQVKASWVRAASMHLTLRFMGDVSKQEIKGIIRAMEETAATCRSFTVFAGGVGVFPGIRKARVIWSGVKGELDQLGLLHTTLEKNLEHQGFPGDKKRFAPHFTLGRFKNRVDSKILTNIIQRFQYVESDVCPVNAMVLFKSELKPSGAVHTPLFKAQFMDKF